MNARIRVLIVDDSAVVRRSLSDSLEKCPDIEVVGTAVDPYAARDKIRLLNPDVLTLDIEMPRMDGLTFLKLLMQRRPMPVVILSSLTGSGSSKALEALQAGAVEVLEKPAGSLSAFEDHARLVHVIKAAARAKLRSPREAHLAPNFPSPTSGSPHPAPHRSGPRRFDARRLVLLGASTGGTEAIKSILTRLSPDLPGVCIVQHIPALFSAAFAQRLNDLSQLEVREAQSGDRVLPGLALVAPGGYHMVLEWSAQGYLVRLSQGPKVHYQRPAVDVLFGSALRAGRASQVLAILLTGMGCDGAASMLELRQAGACTVAQDEATCVVFGMPREAIALGAAQIVLPLDQMAPQIQRYADEAALPPFPAEALAGP
jgi:two-component system, chemotaxis family, protein-glutamate methylesterase/glutaminase